MMPPVRQKLKLTFDWLVVALTFVDWVAPDAASASIVYCAAAPGEAASATGSEPEQGPMPATRFSTDIRDLSARIAAHGERIGSRIDRAAWMSMEYRPFRDRQKLDW
ncbi:hypothetical protein [Burkholderia territorii]|uniref:hypothetical protein n=1 Tax=Burkholderia territorii TaxID=1503055 RepID=UPI0018C6496D|nr:hypothetical protein [Burkholderia territorii]